MSPPLQTRLDAAMDLAERAGELAVEMRPPPGNPRGTLKGPQNWVTEADGATLRQGGSGALGLIDVATGRQDGYAELHINLWDVAAALVILREAGAKVSDFLAGTGPIEGNPIVACAPGLATAWSSLPGVPKPL